MSSPWSVKRRRLNESTARLAKPFVSPLRATNPDQQPRQPEDKENKHVYLPSTLAHTVRTPSQESSPAHVVGQRTSFAPAKSAPMQRQNAYTRSSKRKDPAEFQAERAITSLEMQIRAVKNDIDTLKQAAQISSSNTEADLEALAQKWRQASQTAAEELFGTVKERVNRMGGVTAWRQSEKNKFHRSHGLGEFAEQPEQDNNADCEFDSQGEELPEEEQEYRKRQKKKARQEMMDAADVAEIVVEDRETKDKTVWEEPGGEDDAFTMDMMLRSLNIELKTIGYDKRMQRWVA